MPQILPILSIKEINKLSPSKQLALKSRWPQSTVSLSKKYKTDSRVKTVKEADLAYDKVSQFVKTFEKDFRVQIEREPSKKQIVEDFYTLCKPGDMEFNKIWKDEEIMYNKYSTKEEYLEKRNEVERYNNTNANANSKINRKRKKPIQDDIEAAKLNNKNYNELSDREVMRKYQKKQKRFKK